MTDNEIQETIKESEAYITLKTMGYIERKTEFDETDNGYSYKCTITIQKQNDPIFINLSYQEKL